MNVDFNWNKIAESLLVNARDLLAKCATAAEEADDGHEHADCHEHIRRGMVALQTGASVKKVGCAGVHAQEDGQAEDRQPTELY